MPINEMNRERTRRRMELLDTLREHLDVALSHLGSVVEVEDKVRLLEFEGLPKSSGESIEAKLEALAKIDPRYEVVRDGDGWSICALEESSGVWGIDVKGQPTLDAALDVALDAYGTLF